VILRGYKGNFFSAAAMAIVTKQFLIKAFFVLKIGMIICWFGAAKTG